MCGVLHDVMIPTHRPPPPTHTSKEDVGITTRFPCSPYARGLEELRRSLADPCVARGHVFRLCIPRRQRALVSYMVSDVGISIGNRGGKEGEKGGRGGDRACGYLAKLRVPPPHGRESCLSSLNTSTAMAAFLGEYCRLSVGNIGGKGWKGGQGGGWREGGGLPLESLQKLRVPSPRGGGSCLSSLKPSAATSAAAASRDPG